MNPTDLTKTFPLPWNEAPHYWVCLVPGPTDEVALQRLRQAGFSPCDGINGWMCKAGKPWNNVLDSGIAALGDRTADVRVAVIAGGTTPTADAASFNLRPLAEMQAIGRSLWLGEALNEKRLRCYLQPIIDKRGKVFGHEAFARVETTDGEVIGGGQIIEACRALNIEHMVDRHLHIEAVRTFITSDLGGFLFVNFVPGFIHRPAVYLEGLAETVTRYAVSPKHIVLDFTKSETPRDPAHLKSIFDYCHSKGYSLSLDDIESVETATRLLAATRPDFLKLDIALVRRAMQSAAFDTIATLVEVAHHAGCTVIAEGVETEETHQTLLKAGVDLFQGYLFSPPVAASQMTRRASM